MNGLAQRLLEAGGVDILVNGTAARAGSEPGVPAMNFDAFCSSISAVPLD